MMQHHFIFMVKSIMITDQNHWSTNIKIQSIFIQISSIIRSLGSPADLIAGLKIAGFTFLKHFVK